jgi:hypothetical protein
MGSKRNSRKKKDEHVDNVWKVNKLNTAAAFGLKFDIYRLLLWGT